MVPGGPVPPGWSGAPRVVVGPHALDDPGPVVTTLHGAWLERRPVVVELAADPDALPAGPERHGGPVYTVGPGVHILARGAPPLPRLGQRLRRPGAGETDLVARPQGRSGLADSVSPRGAWPTQDRSGRPAVVDRRGPPRPAEGRPRDRRRPPVECRGGEARPPGRDAGGRPGPGPTRRRRARVRPGPGDRASQLGKTRVLAERLRLLVPAGAPPGPASPRGLRRPGHRGDATGCADVLDSDGPHVRTLNSLGLWICNESRRVRAVRVLEEIEVRELISGSSRCGGRPTPTRWRRTWPRCRSSGSDW